MVKKSNSKTKPIFYPGFVTYLLLTFMSFNCIQCTSVKTRLLITGDLKKPECLYTDLIDKKHSEIEEKIIKNHGLFTRTLILKTNFGSPDKFLTVCRQRQLGDKEFVLVFQFVDRYDYDIFKKEMFFLLDDGKIVSKKIIQDPATVIISEISNQYFYISVSKEEFLTIANSKQFSCKIEHVDFVIPFDCREEWREFGL